MFSRLCIVWSCLLILGGCASTDEPMPKITHTLTPRVTLPPVNKGYPNPGGVDRNIPRDWLPPSGVEKKWTAIVIHHSATTNGSAAIFDKVHRENKYWDGIAYDFVIGNGTNSSDGAVEVTFRWRKQLTGAHCKTPNNWANEKAVGICLVGDFNQTVPTRRQMQSLVKLVRFLQNRYRIVKSRVYGHKTTPGARVTDCPGQKFPMVSLKSMLDF
jgi:hypothetical protein